MQIILHKNTQLDQWPGTFRLDDIESRATLLKQALFDTKRDRIVLEYDIWDDHYSLVEQAVSRRTDFPLRIGVFMSTDVNPTSIDDRVHTLALIKIRFDQYSDGRGFSLAAILRSQRCFRGELRATNVVRENLAMLNQCGFDSFELVKGAVVTDALGAFNELPAYTA